MDTATEFGPGYTYYLVHDGFGAEPFGVAREKDDVPDVEQWTDAGWVEAQWLAEYIENFGAGAGAEAVSGDEARQWVQHAGSQKAGDPAASDGSGTPPQDSGAPSDGAKPPAAPPAAPKPPAGDVLPSVAKLQKKVAPPPGVTPQAPPA